MRLQVLMGLMCLRVCAESNLDAPLDASFVNSFLALTEDIEGMLLPLNLTISYDNETNVVIRSTENSLLKSIPGLLESVDSVVCLRQWLGTLVLAILHFLDVLSLQQDLGFSSLSIVSQARLLPTR